MGSFHFPFFFNHKVGIPPKKNRRPIRCCRPSWCLRRGRGESPSGGPQSADFLNTSVSFSNPWPQQKKVLSRACSPCGIPETTNDNVVFQLDPWDDLAAARAWMNLAGPQTLVLPRSRSDQASPARILAVTGLPGRALADGAVNSDPRSLTLFAWPTSSKWF